MKTISIVQLLIISAAILLSAEVKAQIGPDLRPPGLSDTHPINSYTASGKKVVTDYLDESWELNTGDVVFSAARTRQLISEAPSTIHVITSKQIAAHGWRTLAEILRHVPGVQTIMNKSQFQSVMIRGLVGTEDNNSRILWLQNGVPMNDVRDSGIWLDETYPIEMIKRIEIVLGPGSALYGSGAFQGVVNIFTKDAEDIGKYGEYRLSMQNNLTFKASAIAAYTSENKKLSILGHVAGNTTQGPGLIGDYVYTNYVMDQAAASIASSQAPTSYRYESIDSSSAKHWYNIDFKFRYDTFKWQLGFTDIYANSDGSEIVPTIPYSVSEKGSDDVWSNPVNDQNLYHFNRREFYNDFIYEFTLNESLSMMTVLSYRYGQYFHENYGIFSNNGNLIHSGVISDNGLTSEYKKLDFATDIDTFQHKLYAQYQVNWQIYKANSLIAGLALEYQHITSDDFLNKTTSGVLGEISNESDFEGIYSALRTSPLQANEIGHVTPSVYLQDEQRFWNDRIILTLGGRFDIYRIYGSDDFSPNYVPSWRFAFLGKWTEWMTMRLAYGYAFKEPSLYQLYVNTYDVVGNPMLKPEELHNVELAFLFTPTYFMKIRLDGFATFMDNLIIMQYDKNLSLDSAGIAGRFTPKQTGEGAYIFGFELSLDTSIGDNWSLYSHYNFLYSKRNYDYTTASEEVDDDIEKDRVPDDAMHRFKVGATYMSDRVAADLAFFLVGGTPRTESNDTKVGSYQTPFYAIIQPQVSINVGADIGIILQGSYAFSEGMTKSPTYRYYYEKQGIPVSRYSFMVGLQYPFEHWKLGK